MDAENVVQQALDVALDYGWIDGDHHKAWVIDQMVRVLAGEDYDKLIEECVDWDEGIPP